VYLIQLKIIEKNYKRFSYSEKNETNNVIPIEYVLHFEVLANSILEFGWRGALKRLDSNQSAGFIFICIAVKLSKIAN